MGILRCHKNKIIKKNKILKTIRQSGKTKRINGIKGTNRTRGEKDKGRSETARRTRRTERSDGAREWNGGEVTTGCKPPLSPEGRNARRERVAQAPAMVAGRLWWMSQDAPRARAHVRGPIRRPKAANPMAVTVCFKCSQRARRCLRRYKLRAASFLLFLSASPLLFPPFSVPSFFDLFIHLFNSMFLVLAPGIARER